MVCGVGPAYFCLCSFTRRFPRLQHDLDRRPGTSSKRTRGALAGAVLLEVREDRVKTFAAHRHARERQLIAA